MKLRQWRLTARLTQQQLANKAKVARSSIAHLENGYYAPSISVARKLSRALSSELGMELELYDIFERVRDHGTAGPSLARLKGRN